MGHDVGMRDIRPWILGPALVVLAACGSSGSASSPPASPSASASNTSQAVTPGIVPTPAHTVVVVLENHAYSEVIGDSAAPFINRIAAHGAVFTDSHAITHPSEPNYLALFSGSTQGVTSDSCPNEYTAP